MSQVPPVPPIPTSDPFIMRLLTTGKSTVEMVDGIQPMLVGAVGNEERIVIALPDHGPPDHIFARYVQALTICLHSGIDTLYELRDAFVKRWSGDRLQRPSTPLYDDPGARRCLVIWKYVLEGAESPSQARTGLTLGYGLDDQGKVTFDESPEPLLPDRTAGEPLYEVLLDTVKRWKEVGRPTLELEEINEMRLRVGLLGRVVGEDGEPIGEEGESV